jgi:hypothetical protein
MPSDSLSDLASDRLVGVAAIAAFRGEAPRRTRYLLDIGVIPHGREGTTYVASKAVLREHHRKITGGSGQG